MYKHESFKNMNDLNSFIDKQNNQIKVINIQYIDHPYVFDECYPNQFHLFYFDWGKTQQQLYEDAYDRNRLQALNKELEKETVN